MICPLRQRAICRVAGRSVCGRRKGYSCSVTSQLPASSTGRVWANVREGSFITEGDEVLKLNSSVSRCVEPPGLEHAAWLWHNVAAHDHVSKDSLTHTLYCTQQYIRVVWKVKRNMQTKTNKLCKMLMFPQNLLIVWKRLWVGFFYIKTTTQQVEPIRPLWEYNIYQDIH